MGDNHKLRVDNNYLFGISWFLLSLIISVSNDVITKYLTSGLSSWEITFFRFLFGIISLLPFMIFYGKKSFATSNKYIHLARGLLLFIGIGSWNYGVNLVPITTVTIMSFTIPIFVLILASIFLKEIVTLKLWLATLLGLVGIVIVLNPLHVDFNMYSMIFILAAIMFASLDIINKKYVVVETMLGMLFYSTAVTTVFSIYPAMMTWKTPSSHDLLLLIFLGIGSNLILYCLLKAYALVKVSSVASLRYLELILSVLAGYFIFNTLPQSHVYLGGGGIILCTIFIVYTQLPEKNKKKAID